MGLHVVPICKKILNCRFEQKIRNTPDRRYSMTGGCALQIEDRQVKRLIYPHEAIFHIGSSACACRKDLLRASPRRHVAVAQGTVLCVSVDFTGFLASSMRIVAEAQGTRVFTDKPLSICMQLSKSIASPARRHAPHSLPRHASPCPPFPTPAQAPGSVPSGTAPFERKTAVFHSGGNPTRGVLTWSSPVIERRESFD